MEWFVLVPGAVFLRCLFMSVISSPQTEDEFVYWPSREEAMNCMVFTVTLINKDRLCLSSGEQIIIHDFILEATQVPEWLHFDCFRTQQHILQR